MAQKEVIGFGRRTANTLHTIARQFIGGKTSGELTQRPNGNQVGAWLMKATSIITPCNYKCFGQSGEPEPGTGTAVICYRDDSSNEMKIYNPGDPTGAIVYNPLAETVPINRFFWCKRDLAGTLWVESILPACPAPGSGSGGGSGPGSGSGCIDVVTDVRFDVYTCQLIVCTRNICFPPGTIIGPEDCGSGSGG